MSHPIYPAELPRPDRSGYALGYGEKRRFVQDDDGAMRFGGKRSKMAQSVSLNIEVDRNGRAVFERFFETMTKGGITPFLMTDYATDGVALLTDDGVQILTDGDEPILLHEVWLCTFGKDDLPTRAAISGSVNWLITFTVRVMP